MLGREIHQRRQEAECREGAAIFSIVEGGLPEKGISEERYGGSEEASCVMSWGRSLPAEEIAMKRH